MNIIIHLARQGVYYNSTIYGAAQEKPDTAYLVSFRAVSRGCAIYGMMERMQGRFEELLK